MSKPLSAKRPGEKLKLSIDWRKRLVEGDSTIGPATVTATNAMVITEITTSDNITTFFVSGGSDSEETRLNGCISGSIATAGGETLEACGTLPISKCC